MTREKKPDSKSQTGPVSGKKKLGACILEKKQQNHSFKRTGPVDQSGRREEEEIGPPNPPITLGGNLVHHHVKKRSRISSDGCRNKRCRNKGRAGIESDAKAGST